jgi:hypothetical protein
MITWEAISKATEPMKTVNIKGKEYVQVTERVKAFRSICPGGSIATEIVSLTDNMVIMKTTITDEDGKVLSTGMAFERPDSSYINKTSYIENCETSAVGRALGWLAIGVDASMASAEELVNALKGQERIKAKEAEETAPTYPNEVNDIAAAEQGAKNTKRLKELSAKTGFSSANLKDWKNMAVDNKIIPEKKWAEYNDTEMNNFVRFVEASATYAG